MPVVNCVIVTYNRLPLLQECITAVQSQTYPIKKIIIINNASADGTEEYLSTLPKDVFETYNLEKNTGGAGGFNKGLKESYKIGADWSWVMDDDTIPQSNSLEKLVQKTPVDPRFGFFASTVLFTDGTPHIMNTHTPDDLHDFPYNFFLANNILLQSITSFVSCLISHLAIKTVGLPIADFFIWSDDIEYTQRITKAGFLGAVALDSFAIHKTATNYSSSIRNASPEFFWRFRFDLRNQTYVLRKKYSLCAFLYHYIKMVVLSCYNCMKRKDYRMKMLGIILRSAIAGLFFLPKVEMA